MSRYYEKFEKTKHIRDEQYQQLETYLSKNLRTACEKREDYFRPDFSSTEKYSNSICEYREELKRVIGYPPPHIPKGVQCKEEFIGEDELCFIYRIFIDVAEDLECYGLYMIPKAIKGKAPVALAFHGGGGCPELICGFERTDNYNDASRKLLKKGYIVFSPLFSFRSYADADNTDIPPNMRMILDKRAKWLGTSLAAIEVFKVRKALDYLSLRNEVDKKSIIAVGLSYGGFYALLISALDERIGSCICSCYFNDRVLMDERYPADFGDWVWAGSLSKFSDTELVALICPRTCIIEIGKGDDLFPIDGARNVIGRAKGFYEKLGIVNHLKYYEFEGGHEFNLGFLDEFVIPPTV